MYTRNVRLHYVYKANTTKIAAYLSGVYIHENETNLHIFCIVLLLDLKDSKQYKRVMESIYKSTYDKGKIADCCLRETDYTLYTQGYDWNDFSWLDNVNREDVEEMGNVFLHHFKLDSLAKLGNIFYYYEQLGSVFGGLSHVVPSIDSDAISLEEYIKLTVRTVRSFKVERHFPKLQEFVCNFVSDKYYDAQEVFLNIQRDKMTLLKYKTHEYIKSFLGYVTTSDNIKHKFTFIYSTYKKLNNVGTMKWFVQDTYIGGKYPNIDGLQYFPKNHKVLFRYLNALLNDDKEERQSIEDIESFYMYSSVYYQAVLDMCLTDKIIDFDDMMDIRKRSRYCMDNIDSFTALDNLDFAFLKARHRVCKLPIARLRAFREDNGSFNALINGQLYNSAKLRYTKQCLMSTKTTVNNITMSLNDDGELKELFFTYK